MDNNNKKASDRIKPGGEESSSEDMKQIIRNIEDEEGTVDNRILKIAAKDVEVSSHEDSILKAEKEKKQETFYSDLIYTLAHIRLDEVEARITWGDILAHKAEMSEAMKRNVGIRVAALDYFQNLQKVFDDVRIIDSSQYIKTQKLVVTDGLTGLFNHRYFYEKLSMFIKEVDDGERKNIGIMVIDLDYFKQYNDANGHIAGDIVLIEVSKIFRNTSDNNGIAFRYGGEEFAVLMPETQKDDLSERAERMRKKVEERKFANEVILPQKKVTISIGLSIYPDLSPDARQLFDNADRALYLAKKLGRNRIEIYEH